MLYCQFGSKWDYFSFLKLVYPNSPHSCLFSAYFCTHTVRKGWNWSKILILVEVMVWGTHCWWHLDLAIYSSNRNTANFTLPSSLKRLVSYTNFSGFFHMPQILARYLIRMAVRWLNLSLKKMGWSKCKRCGEECSTSLFFIFILFTIFLIMFVQT